MDGAYDHLIVRDVESALSASRERELAADRERFASLIAKAAALPPGALLEQGDAVALAELCEKLRQPYPDLDLAELITSWRELERARENVARLETVAAGLPDPEDLYAQFSAMNLEIAARIDELLKPKRVLLAAIEESVRAKQRAEGAKSTERSIRRQWPVLFP